MQTRKERITKDVRYQEWTEMTPLQARGRRGHFLFCSLEKAIENGILCCYNEFAEQTD